MGLDSAMLYWLLDRQDTGGRVTGMATVHWDNLRGSKYHLLEPVDTLSTSHTPAALLGKTSPENPLIQMVCVHDSV